MNPGEFITLSKLYGQKVIDGRICPLCSGELVQRLSIDGEFIGCSNFINGCHFTKRRMCEITSVELEYYKNLEEE